MTRASVVRQILTLMRGLSVTDKSPEAIGSVTRALVESYLASYPAFIPQDGFLERIERFAAELLRWGTRLNLTATPDDPAELAFHILDSLMPLLLSSANAPGAFANAFSAGQQILDLGSGAGFPGLVLAAATDASFILTEARRKRASFLNAAATAMNLASVRVDNRHRTAFAPESDVVTARALAQPVVFYETSDSALKPGGVRILYASVRQKPEIEKALADRKEEASFHEYDPPRVNPFAGSRQDPVRRLLVISRRSEA